MLSTIRAAGNAGISPCRRIAGSLIAFAGIMLSVLTAQMVFTACSPRENTAKPKPSVPVMVAPALKKSVPVQIRAIGNVEAFASVSVKSQVNGLLEKVHFREGDDVKKGQLLFTIDSRPYEAAMRQAKAALARDEAQEKYARRQAKRYGELLADGIVTQDQYDQLTANADALAESVRADRAAVDNATVQLGYCFIRSPLDGRTGNLLVQQGNLVKANDTPVLVTLNQVTPIHVTFSVPEKELAEIRKYMAAGTVKVEAALPDAAASSEQGALSFLDNAVDAATGTIKIKGTFANRERRLWPGQFVTVILTLTTIPDAVVVPSQAVQTGQAGSYVFVVKTDRSVELRPVTAGGIHAGEIIIEKGVRPSETVVTDGHLQLVPGARVSLKTNAVNGKAIPR
jgi:membrane fusion protein, multidrug efflux system